VRPLNSPKVQVCSSTKLFQLPVGLPGIEHDTGIKADVFIGSGDVPKILSLAAKQTNADLLVTGCYPYGGNLRTHGYGIICAVPIPILNV